MFIKTAKILELGAIIESFSVKLNDVPLDQDELREIITLFSRIKGKSAIKLTTKTLQVIASLLLEANLEATEALMGKSKYLALCGYFFSKLTQSEETERKQTGIYFIINAAYEKIKAIKALREIIRTSSVIKRHHPIYDSLRFCKEAIEANVVLGPFTQDEYNQICLACEYAAMFRIVPHNLDGTVPYNKFYNKYHKTL